MNLNITVHVHHHGCDESRPNRIDWRLEEISARIDHITKQGDAIMSLGSDILAWQKATNAVADTILGKLDELIAKIQAGQPITAAELAAIQAEAVEQQAQNQAGLDKIAAALGGGVPAVIVLPAGVAGQPYSTNVADKFDKTGRFAPFSYVLASGALPPDFALDSSNANLGNTVATVATAGEFSFSISCNDASPDTTDETKSFSITIA